MKVVFVFLLLFGSSLSLRGEEAGNIDSAEIQKQIEGLARAEVSIERLKNAPAEEAMPKLGEILRKTSMRSIYQVDERWETHEKAKSAILALPEHADFFRDEFKRFKSEFRDKGDENRYDLERAMLFEVMRQLPSPEIVPLLGALLEDDEDEPPPPRPDQDYVDYPANSRLAAGTLGRLLDKPPTQTDPRTYRKADVHVWKLWFAQVKAGTKGFQFKGSDTVHYLAAPAKDERRPSAIEPSPPVPENRTPPLEDRNPPKNEPQKFPLVATLSALGLLALAVAWLAISRRNGTARS